MKFARFIVNTFKPLMRFLCPVKWCGDRKFDSKRTLMLGNHLSGWDMILITIYMKSDIAFAYKAELDRSAFLHWALSSLDGFPVHRGDVDITSAKSIIKTLNNEKILAMFPEGTRNPKVDCLQNFKTGAAFYALKTHSAIRPFYIWEKTKLFRKNYIVVGEEFTLEEFYDKPLTKEVLLNATQLIKDKIDALRISLNAELEKKGVSRRRRTQKETDKIIAYNARQRTLEKTIAEMENND